MTTRGKGTRPGRSKVFIPNVNSVLVTRKELIAKFLKIKTDSVKEMMSRKGLYLSNIDDCIEFMNTRHKVKPSQKAIEIIEKTE